MLALLWLTVWATVAEAYYDDYNWYTSGDELKEAYDVLKSPLKNCALIGGVEKAFNSQRFENFSDILRSFAKSMVPTRDGDEELTMTKVKSRLRSLKVFKHTGSERDYEPNKGLLLPLHEGAKFCSMGRHTKVDCNHCTCVAGQLYMCTGMICAKAQKKPQGTESCKEGKKRKIDSCNYCYCRNGHEICSTKDCRLKHNANSLRNKFSCREGTHGRKQCNKCICRNGEQYCTAKLCYKTSKLTGLSSMIKKQKSTQDAQPYRHLRNEEKKCVEGSHYKLDFCNHCLCLNGTEMCTRKPCLNLKGQPCLKGSVRQVDPCNYCTCQDGKYTCTNKPCKPRLIQNSLKEECDPWDIKYEKCNRCECHDNRWVCTQKQCDGNGDKETKIEAKRELKNDENRLQSTTQIRYLLYLPLLSIVLLKKV